MSIPLLQIIGGSSASQTTAEYGIGGACSSTPVVHDSLLTTVIMLVWLKLISRTIYFFFMLENGTENPSLSLAAVALNSAAFVFLMLIVIMMNKVKLHLIYVR